MSTIKSIGPALNVLALIRANPCATTDSMAIDLGRGVASIKRDIRLLRQLGVKIEYDPRAKEYNIEDYGIFNPERI